MSWIKGFAFRSSAGFVTDGPTDTYVLVTDLFPTIRNGVTFGWLTTGVLLGVNGNAGVDPRLAGVNQFIGIFAPPNQALFQVTLDAAVSTQIQIANGDIVNSRARQYWELRDNATVLTTFAAASVSVATFNDATGVNRSAAAWPGSNAPLTAVFATTTFIFALGDASSPSGESAVPIAYIGLSQTVAPPATGTGMFIPITIPGMT